MAIQAHSKHVALCAQSEQHGVGLGVGQPVRALPAAHGRPAAQPRHVGPPPPAAPPPRRHAPAAAHARLHRRQRVGARAQRARAAALARAAAALSRLLLPVTDPLLREPTQPNYLPLLLVRPFY